MLNTANQSAANATQRSPIQNRYLNAHKAQEASILHSGDYLFHMNEPLAGIYLINAGAVKVCRITEFGDQQIIGLYMGGDVIGLDALCDGISQSQAVALDTTSVTLLPFRSLLKGNEKVNTQDLIRRMGITLNRDNDLIMMLSQRTADRRLAWFLVEFSDCLKERGLSSKEFSLPMTRTDIAIYLGLALETVCRELTNFEQRQWIKKDKRRFRLLDIAAIRHLACGDCSCHSAKTKH